MNKNVNLARLKWACRRGMLELDVLFTPFVETRFLDCTLEQQQIFEQLLTEADPELFAWFMGHEQAPAHYQEIITIVRGREKP